MANKATPHAGFEKIKKKPVSDKYFGNRATRGQRKTKITMRYGVMHEKKRATIQVVFKKIGRYNTHLLLTNKKTESVKKCKITQNCETSTLISFTLTI